MEFEYSYTQEQEHFRLEVGTWLDANLPEGVARAGALPDVDAATWEQCHAFLGRLDQMGWLNLSADLAVVFLEELAKRRLGWLLDDSSSKPLRFALQQWGTESQRGSYLTSGAPDMGNVWRMSVESGAQPDVSNLGIRAFRDGDDIILDGQDMFSGRGLWPDYLWVLAVVRPEAPPEQATATFLVPGGLQGITIQVPKALLPWQNHRVIFDHVRVFPDAMLGPEGDGWSVMQSGVQSREDIRHPVVFDQDVDDLLKYAQETTREGQSLGKDPVLQQFLVESYINSRITRLFKLRNAWMASTGQPITYQQSETALWEKEVSMRLSRIVRDIMGMYALLDPDDARAPMGGQFQFQQRQSLAVQNPTGASEVYRVEMAKQIGLGQRKDGGESGHSHDAPAGASGLGSV